MKKILIVLLFATFLFSGITCKKAIDDTIDCIFESAFVVVHADLDSINPKLMHFKFVYTPSEGYSLEQPIHWDFGDGESINGDTIIDHIYEVGTYEAIASYTLRKGSSTCSSSSKKHIEIH